MPDIGLPELLIVAVLALLLLGPGKVVGLGGALGRSVRELRRASGGEGDQPSGAPPARPAASDSGTALPTAAPGAVSRSAPDVCSACGAAMSAQQRFCTNCGSSRPGA